MPKIQTHIFFVKMDKDADDKSKEFFNKIKDSKRYKRFTTKEELLNYVKISLRECMINNSKKIFLTLQSLMNQHMMMLMKKQ